MYSIDKDFKEMYKICSQHSNDLFHIKNDFLLKGPKLCIPKGGLKELLIGKVH